MLKPAFLYFNVAQVEENVEDLIKTLYHQIKTSDWLKENTAEKWLVENPKAGSEILENLSKHRLSDQPDTVHLNC